MPVSFLQHTLPNGLRIVAEVDPDAHSSAAGFFVKTGARDEATPVMGVSHFLEHMMFKGTSAISAEELNRRFDAMGAHSNAYTSNEMTCFHAHVLPEFLDPAVSLLGEMMRPALRDDDFTTEKKVILEEIAMCQDNPFLVLYEAAIERHFGAHPLSHRVLGTPESIGAMTSAQMRAYFDERYSADNTVLALAGRMDFDAVCRRVEAVCGHWSPTRVTRDASKPAYTGGEFTIRRKSTNRGYLIAMFDAPPIDDERRYAASVLAMILGKPDNSRLHWALIEPGIAEDAQASSDPHDGFGSSYVFACAEPDRLDEVWRIIRRELDNLAGSLTQDDIDLLLEKAATAVTLGGERPNDRMQRLGRLWTSIGTYRSLEEELANIRAVTLGDLRDLCRAFPFNPITVGRLTPD